MPSLKILELKHFCNDFAAVRKVLVNLGAERKIVKKQKDYFFNLPVLKNKTKNYLKMRIEDNKIKGLGYYERPGSGVVSSVESRIENYATENKQLLDFLKKSLGELGVVEKIREVWRLKNTIFHLDTIKNVGTIFEIELEKKHSISEKDKKLFEGYKSKLLPYLGKAVQGSNIDLVRKKF